MWLILHNNFEANATFCPCYPCEEDEVQGCYEICPRSHIYRMAGSVGGEADSLTPGDRARPLGRTAPWRADSPWSGGCPRSPENVKPSTPVVKCSMAAFEGVQGDPLPIFSHLTTPSLGRLQRPTTHQNTHTFVEMVSSSTLFLLEALQSLHRIVPPNASVQSNAEPGCDQIQFCEGSCWVTVAEPGLKLGSNPEHSDYGILGFC